VLGGHDTLANQEAHLVDLARGAVVAVELRVVPRHEAGEGPRIDERGLFPRLGFALSDTQWASSWLAALAGFAPARMVILVDPVR
jgi:hypothetical protein